MQIRSEHVPDPCLSMETASTCSAGCGTPESLVPEDSMKKDGSTALLIPGAGSPVKAAPKEMTASNSYKTLSLVVLIVQTTALVLVLRFSRTQKVEGPKYLSSTAVLMAEAVKVVTCFVVLFKECNFRFPVLINAIDRDVIQRPMDFLKMSVPAVLYVVQNNLLFLALSKLDAATYQVTYQLKILTTAFFTVVIMQRTLLKTQWVALLLLTGGVALVQMPSGDSSKAEVAHNSSEHFVGLIAVIAACLTSGFAGVFLEKILKQGSIGLWMRNLQLAFFSIFGALFMCWAYDGEAIGHGGLLQGYNGSVWTVVMLQAYGGLVIALVVKYADNILK
ncbi:hypothetical protein PFISCL1PPCAC_3980, partial [Pristionchus fissidentatus]